jgi:UDP-N-acetylglucosamine--N-acetylmuramyl-(pentapeptide) pyrophosphoryl-undecaprenol N-acetylglucosamine transferase
VTRLLVASTGGHLSELVRLAPRLWPGSDDELWVTFDSKQSRAWLAGRRVRFVRNTKPRDWQSVLLNLRSARRIIDGEIDSVVSTGAAVALSFLPLANAKGISTHYIESCARVQAPSLTGRLLTPLGGIRLYTQHPGLADSRWHYSGSVFDTFRAVDVASPPPLLRVFVTIGTLDYSFGGLIERLRATLPENVEVLVQAGRDSERVAWPGARMVSFMDPVEIRAAIARADVVVAHAGIGSALVTLEQGKIPILVPRLASKGEHVDDHQTQIAGHLAGLGLAVMADSRTVGMDHFAMALSRRAIRQAPEARFMLR